MLTIIPNNAIPAATHDIDMFGPRIGVKAAVDISPYASFVPRASKQEFAAVVVSWGSPAGDPRRPVLSLHHLQPRNRHGLVERFRYTNPEFDSNFAAAVMKFDVANAKPAAGRDRPSHARHRDDPDPPTVQRPGQAADVHPSSARR